MKTLKPIAIDKIIKRFADSLSHANFVNNGKNGKISICNILFSQSIVKIYIYFDDSFSGCIEQVELVDKDGDIVAAADGQFIKQDDKGYYVAFKYKVDEIEVDSVEAL